MIEKRLIYIDIARAICIILVVTGHYTPNNSPAWYMDLHNVIYSFHMPLFMFISGYIYWATRKPVVYKTFIRRKFQRLIMPYFFVSIVVIAIKLLTESSLQVESPISLTAFYQMLYLPTTAGSFLWFVYTLFLIFLIMPFFNSHKKLSVLLVGALILRYIPIPFTSYFGLIHIKAMLFFFVLGSVLCEWVVIRKIIGKVHIFVTLSAFIGVYILKSHTDVAIILEIIILMLALLGIGATIKVSKILEQTTKIRSILLYVAVCSYTIYLFHTTFEGFAKAVLIKIAKCTFPNVNHTILFMLTTIVVILSGIICPMIIHKIATQNSKILSYLIGEKNISREV